MLAHLLALLVGLGSFVLYMAAFFFPEVHRKNDFIWSGFAMFYALVLWVYAGRITGGVLLGQVVSVSLLGWLGWQTLKLRRDLTPYDQQTWVPGSKSVGEVVFENAERVWGQVQQQIERLPLPEPIRTAPKKISGLFAGSSTPSPGKLAASPKAKNTRTPVTVKPKSARQKIKPSTVASTEATPTEANPPSAEPGRTAPTVSSAQSAEAAETEAIAPPNSSAEPENVAASPESEIPVPVDADNTPDGFDDSDEPIQGLTQDEAARLQQATVKSPNRFASLLGNRKPDSAPRPNSDLPSQESAAEPPTSPENAEAHIFELGNGETVYEIDDITGQPVDLVPDDLPIANPEMTTSADADSSSDRSVEAIAPSASIPVNPATQATNEQDDDWDLDWDAPPTHPTHPGELANAPQDSETPANAPQDASSQIEEMDVSQNDATRVETPEALNPEANAPITLGDELEAILGNAEPSEPPAPNSHS
ncbi:Ycf66 family protein [Leptolyngbya sp. AN02str]|uniref:Ycf66 family protein n=1 Tax=Leptolyngbya sp. AN02str TaxID=3423363 RepID=UPI003D3206BD